MRILDDNALLRMDSPIKWTFRNIHNAIINIAPEKRNKFESEHNDFILEYLDSPEWICGVIIENKHIKISRGVVELLWCLAYSHIVLYCKKIGGNRFGPGTQIDLTSDLDIFAGTQLMAWALNNLFYPNMRKPWPLGLPQPTKNPKKGSWVHFGNEFCLCAVAYIIHHELAHIRLKHNADIKSIDQERDADYEASDWIMDGTESDELVFTKRLLGISLALQAITIRSIYSGKFSSSSHPRSFDRLYNTLSRYLTDNDHVVYAITAVALQLHMQGAKLVGEPGIYDDVQQCFNDYIEKLAQKEGRPMAN